MAETHDLTHDAANKLPVADTASGGSAARSFLRFLSVSRRVLRRFVRISGRERLLLLEAVTWLAIARVGSAFVPFQYLAPRFGKLSSAAQAGAQAGLMPTQSDLQWAREIGWAVTRAARYVPFRAVCLPQAIAAKTMLARRGIPSIMHFGVSNQHGSSLQAHAWLDIQGVEVTGFPVRPDFVEIARFA